MLIIERNIQDAGAIKASNEIQINFKIHHSYLDVPVILILFTYEYTSVFDEVQIVHTLKKLAIIIK